MCEWECACVRASILPFLFQSLPAHFFLNWDILTLVLQYHVSALQWRESTVCMCVLSRSVVSDSLWPRGLKPARLHCPWHFPGKNTEVGCHFLLQKIFPTQGWSRQLLRWQAILYRGTVCIHVPPLSRIFLLPPHPTPQVIANIAFQASATKKDPSSGVVTIYWVLIRWKEHTQKMSEQMLKW